MDKHRNAGYPYYIFAERVERGKILPSKTLQNTFKNDFKVYERNNGEHFHKRFADESIGRTNYISDIFSRK